MFRGAQQKPNCKSATTTLFGILPKTVELIGVQHGSSHERGSEAEAVPVLRGRGLF